MGGGTKPKTFSINHFPGHFPKFLADLSECPRCYLSGETAALFGILLGVSMKVAIILSKLFFFEKNGEKQQKTSMKCAFSSLLASPLHGQRGHPPQLPVFYLRLQYLCPKSAQRASGASGGGREIVPPPLRERRSAAARGPSEARVPALCASGWNPS